MKDKIYLAILNITSWAGTCCDAVHVYGHLILSKQEKVTVNNIEEYNINYLGEKIEITQPVTIEIAKQLDEIDGGKSYQRAFYRQEELKNDDNFNELLNTNRFNTFNEVVDAGIKKWKELNLNCPFISLYEGQKYEANSYEPSSTVIISKN